MSDFLQKLSGRDRRSIGRANEVVEDVLDDPTLFEVVFDGMLGEDPIIRMRAADVVEKVTAERPQYLDPYKTVLIGRVAEMEQQEVRWHVAQMIPRLELGEEERRRVIGILQAYLGDKSKIVKTSAMQALADLAEQDAGLVPQVIELLEEQQQAGSPAMNARGRRLLVRLRSEPGSNGSSGGGADGRHGDNQ